LPSSTTTTLPGGEPSLDDALDAILDALLPISLPRSIRRLILSGAGVIPDKGVLRGHASSGDSPSVVVFKGKASVHRPGRVTLRLKLTAVGRRLLKHASATSLPLTVTLSFSGRGVSATRTRTISLSL
jgi:hypothetical protein